MAYPGALALVSEDSPARALWATYQTGDPLDEDRSTDSDEKEEAAPTANTN